jgi:hypothetical protein
VDLHQLAYKDMEENLITSLRISDKIDYCSTNPLLWPIRNNIPRDDLCVIVGMSHKSQPASTPLHEKDHETDLNGKGVFFVLLLEALVIRKDTGQLCQLVQRPNKPFLTWDGRRLFYSLYKQFLT